MLTCIKDGRNYWTVVYNNKMYQFNPSHPAYNELVEMVKNDEGDKLVKTLDIATVITEWSDGDFYVKSGVLFYKEEQVNRVIADRILEMIKEGFDHKPMLRFLERLYKNPSFRAINELYSFLQHKFLPITPDGYFLAYKAVRSDFMDKYSGTIRNQVGDKPSVARHRVDDNCGVGCSYGLHVGSIEYVKSYMSTGDTVVICKVDPSDVVSVPLDCSQQKVRCCQYEVVGIYEGELTKAVVSDYNDEEEYDDEYEYDLSDFACDESEEEHYYSKEQEEYFDKLYRVDFDNRDE
jgi:hypothetical protein